MKCPKCGKDFKPQALGQQYCSRACRIAVEGKIKPKPIQPLQKEESIPKIFKQAKVECRNCGKYFVPAWPGEKFCSDICRIQFFHLDYESDLYTVSL